MENAKSFEQKLARIYDVTGVSTDSALAQILGIKAPSVAAARKRQQIPGAWIEKIAEKFRANANWLLFGVGEKLIDDVFAPESLSASSGDYRQVPVIGLASCSLKGWYNPAPLAITTPAPVPATAENVFAVLAVGHSMMPRGIMPGHVLFCDPGVKPSRNDVVYIERNDGTAAVKALKALDESWVTIEGWLDPSPSGEQTPCQEKFALSAVKRLVSVVFIRIKA